MLRAMRLGTSVNNREVNQPNLIIRSPRAGSMIPLSLYTHLRVEFYEYSNLVKRGEYGEWLCSNFWQRILLIE